MNELQAILKAYNETQHNGDVLLATVVKTQGSTYRRAGARMLITHTGCMVGTISGGCLETDVFEYAQKVLYSQKPTVVTYDTTADEDIIWGLGLGCNGVVQVLIEHLRYEPINPLRFINHCLLHKQQGVIVTVFSVEGGVDLQVGARLLLHADGTVISDIGQNLLPAILTDAEIALRDAQSSLKAYSTSTGSVEVLIEIIQPPTPLVIFGAGFDAVPIAQFAKALGWDVTIVDPRAHDATFERFAVDRIILVRPETVHEQVYLSDRTVAIIITHNYLHDRELLKLLIPSPVCYLGILGPKRRTEKLLQELLAEGIYPDERLYAPIGIDIGADTPAEIAIAIIAEIQAVLTNRCGGFLKHRTQPIHQPTQI